MGWGGGERLRQHTRKHAFAVAVQHYRDAVRPDEVALVEEFDGRQVGCEVTMREALAIDNDGVRDVHQYTPDYRRRAQLSPLRRRQERPTKVVSHLLALEAFVPGQCM